MGGGMKGHGGGGGGYGGGSYNSRSRSYMLMLLLAFGAAIFGVMLLHKLRERRIFNLLTKQKDQQIFSLQLLLQKEREQAQEVKAKMEEMKVKLFNLRTQKSKLNSRVSEMQSTISSLKDEQRTLELAFQDMQNEAKMVKEKYGNEFSDQNQNQNLNQDQDQNQNPQVVALNEILLQKEAEIEDLKRHLESPPVKVWSVSTDDPSISSVNSSAEIKVKDTQVDRGNSIESTNIEESRNVTEDASNSRTENVTTSVNGARETTGEEKSGENSELNSSTDAKEVGSLTEFGLSRKIPDSNEELSVNQKGGMKLEMTRNAENGRHTMKGKRIHLKRTRGKRWRTIVINHIDNNKENSSTTNGALNEDPNTSNIQAKNESTLEREMNMTRSEDNRRSINQGGVEKSEENGQLKERDADATIKQHAEDEDDYEGDKNLGQKEVGDKNEVKMEDDKESATTTSTESMSSLEEENEEERDDLEF